jgi:hypothetical protein
MSIQLASKWDKIKKEAKKEKSKFASSKAFKKRKDVFLASHFILVHDSVSFLPPSNSISVRTKRISYRTVSKIEPDSFLS